MQKFEPGRCYFLVGYLDRNFKLPFVQTYVFVGREPQNASDEKTRYIFQDVHSYSKFGAQRLSDDERRIDVMALDFDALETMLDREALAQEFARLEV